MSETLGERLRALRQARGLRLVDVSRSAGISVSWLNDMEHDRNRPSLDTLLRLATSFDTTVIEILRDVGPFDASS
jgi:transcriptional regulator with XRE-family HTH domain